MKLQERLSPRILRREARIGIVGLGYAGLPLAVAFAEAGFAVVGYERDPNRATQARSGVSYVPDVDDTTLARLVASGRLTVASDPEALRDVDVAILCVPTPVGRAGTPDTSFLESAAAEVAAHVGTGTLVVVESTSYPGTTEERVGGVLAAAGLVPGRDVFLAFSPERIDPGNRSWGVRQIPKVVGGVDAASRALAESLYAQIAPQVVSVSSAGAAEMSKLVENVFREVNIALANEVAQACEVLGLDAWEVIDAAASKPFGFMPFYPGPGRGGHCIPSDPVFLDWRLRQLGFRSRMIDAARSVNEGMPGYVAGRVAGLLEERGIAVEGAGVLLLGVSYKRDVADTRDSPAEGLIAELESMGVRVSYHDPHVSSLRFNGTQMSCRDLEAGLAEADCVVVVADHSAYDWEQVADRAACVLDCRGALRGKELGHVARL